FFFSGGLWKTDGTTVGTVLVSSAVNVVNLVDPSFGSNVIVVNGKLYFAGDDGKNGTELWVSDGTTAGTSLVKDINTGITNVPSKRQSGAVKYANSSNPQWFISLNGKLFF